MDYDSKMKRIMLAGAVLTVYVLVYFLAHRHLHLESVQRDQVETFVATLPASARAAMTQDEINQLAITLRSLESGGAQASVGLSFNVEPLTHYLADEQFDSQSIITLLEQGQFEAAQAKLQTLSAKLENASQNRTQLLQYLAYAGIAGALLIAIYIVYLGLQIWRRGREDMTVVSAGDVAPIVPRNFAEYLDVCVKEEATFTGHHARVNFLGIDPPELPEPLPLIVEQVCEQLVRNSVVHGGRPIEQRVRAGKPEFLSIKATVRETDDAYVVTVRDDGEGINFSDVIKRAHELGMISRAELESMALERAIKLIFEPEFKSRNQHLSVSENDQSLGELRLLAKSIGGGFSIRNQVSQYCEFRVRFPKQNQ